MPVAEAPLSRVLHVYLVVTRSQAVSMGSVVCPRRCSAHGISPRCSLAGMSLWRQRVTLHAAHFLFAPSCPPLSPCGANSPELWLSFLIGRVYRLRKLFWEIWHQLDGHTLPTISGAGGGGPARGRGGRGAGW